MQFSHCSTSGSNVSVVSGGVGTGTYTAPTNSCSVLAKSVRISLDVTWTPKSIKPSIVSYSGLSVVMNKAGDAGYTVPGTGGTVKVVGSFAGNDLGARTTATVYSSETAAQVLSTCSSPSGLASIPFVSGSTFTG